MRLASLALTLGLAAPLALSAAEPSAPPPAAKPSAKPAATAGAAKPVATKSITGKVAKADGQPAAGATVRAVPTAKPSVMSMRGGGRPDLPKSIAGKTDATGAFKLDGLEGGSFAVRVELPGFAPAAAADVPAGASLNLRLKPGLAVIGRVVDLTTQKPIAGATVTGLERDAARFGRDAAHATTSAEDGTFKLADCAPGIVVVEAIAPAKARARLDHVVAKAPAAGEEPKAETNTLYLQPGGRIAGRVVGPDGKPLGDAIVTSTPSDGNLMSMFRDARSSQRTEADGKFVFDGVIAGNKYTVRAAKDGLASREEGPIPIEAGTDRGDVELKLESGATLAVRLLTAQDVPVKDLDARVQPQGNGRRRGFGPGVGDLDKDKIVSQGDGKFLIKALDPGTADVTLQPADYADVVKEGVKLKSGETTDLGTLRVQESKAIGGRVVDNTGQPVEGATISGFWVDGEARFSREAHTGSDGRYRLSGLGEQPVRNLSVRAVGFAEASREGATPGDNAVDFTLDKTGSIVGRVVLANGAIPPAFRVQAFPEAKEKQERPGMRIVIGSRPDDDQIFTDPTGAFRLDGVNPGTVTITAKADGKAPARKSGLAVASEQVVDAGTLTLEDGRALRGRVVASKDDSPIPGASVSVTQPQGMMSMGTNLAAGSAITASDGHFEIDGLEARTYAVDASQPDWSPNSGRVEISADADTDDFVIKLSRGGTITGLVHDAQKQIVPNVSVLLTKPMMGTGPQTASTGPDGRYTFDKIPPGDYMVIRAPAAGGPIMLFGGMKQVTVREGETTTYDIDESSKISLTGRVLKAGQPVPNVMLFFVPSDSGEGKADLRPSRTDANGQYQVGLDNAGTYSVVVNSGSGGFIGGGQSGIQVQVPDQPNPVVDVTMKSSGISGHVVNAADGKAISGAIVSAARSDGSGASPKGRGMQAQSDPDGSFLLDGLDPGTYTLNVAASGFKTPQVPPVTIGNDTDVPAVDVRLESGRTVRGHVIDANGNGISGAMVMTAPAGTVPSARDALPATTDVNGAFVLTAPAEGPIDLTAVAAGFPPARAVSVQPDDGADVVLHAPRPGHIRVSVTDGKGLPLAGARVAYRAVPDFLGATYLTFFDRTPATGPDGTTVVSSMGPGAYELTIAMGGKRTTQSVTLAEGAEVVTAVTLP
jgi:protocatechuate 3,4-dioxygenase beta subunit